MANGRKDFKIGIVGCGRISQSYVQAIKSCEGMNLTAVMDVRPDPANSTAEAAGCKAFTDLDKFVKESAVDAAIICAPPIEHRSIACDLMRNGAHVLCEKPFATTVEDARAMIHCAEENDVVVMMASKFRYVEDIIRAKAMIASGMLGEILFYQNSFCSKVGMRGRWNSDPAVSGGGVIIDNGTHSVDIVRYMLGPIARVSAQEGKRVMELQVEDTGTISFVTEGGINGSIHLSWSIQMDQPGYINIYGTDGALSVGWQESKYQHGTHPTWIPFGVGYSKVAAFKNQVVNFIDTIRGAAPPTITVEDGLASVEVIETAYRTMKQQNWLTMEERTSVRKVAVAS